MKSQEMVQVSRKRKLEENFLTDLVLTMQQSLKWVVLLHLKQGKLTTYTGWGFENFLLEQIVIK